MVSNEREIGEHGARIGTLEERFDKLDEKVDEIRSVLQEARGGWKTLMLVAGAAGAVGAVLGKLLPFLSVKP